MYVACAMLRVVSVRVQAVSDLRAPHRSEADRDLGEALGEVGRAAAGSLD